MTCTALVAGAGVRVPRAFSVAATRVGGTRRPPLAMVWKTPADWMALTASPWPYMTVYRWEPLQSWDLAKMPGVSPGKWIPVSAPTPKARKYFSRVGAGTFSPTFMVPMLLDWAMTPANVSFSTSWSWESRNDWPARDSRLGTSTRVVGVAAPSCRAAAAVMTLAMEPGSNASPKALLPRVPPAAAMLFGSKLGYEATATSAPVFTSMTTTVPDSAFVSPTF